MTGTAAQVVGLVALGLVLTLLWSPWALAIAGVALVAGPELASWHQRQLARPARREPRRRLTLNV